MSPLPARMANRWASRPMLPPGQGQLYWHVLLNDNRDVREIVYEGQQRLATVTGLDFVPSRWIHLTMLVVGPTGELTNDQVAAMIAEARTRLARIPPITVSLGRVLFHPEAIALYVQPAEKLRPLREAVMSATHKAIGQPGVPDQGPWVPHVTLAYSTRDQPAASIIDAAGRHMPSREFTISRLSLIDQDGPEYAWNWRPVTDVPLGEPDEPDTR